VKKNVLPQRGQCIVLGTMSVTTAMPTNGKTIAGASDGVPAHLQT
jgi:hypothetical protein